MPSKQTKDRQPSASETDRKVHLLVVEDEKHLADSIARRLQEEGYLVDLVHDGE
jgi:CheY-like chemotaxis protein